MRHPADAAPIYKICSRTEWDDAVRLGSYAGSADDIGDGYIHLSTAGQVRATAAKYFAGRRDLVLVAVDPERVSAQLKWEPARGGALFPHVYGSLPVSAALWVCDLALDRDGAHAFPDGIA